MPKPSGVRASTRPTVEITEIAVSGELQQRSLEIDHGAAPAALGRLDGRRTLPGRTRRLYGGPEPPT